MSSLRTTIEKLHAEDPIRFTQTSQVPSVIFETREPNGYIWPNLRHLELRKKDKVFLVEAPGAVGKTAAATAISAHLRWPLIDAATTQVGAFTLRGMLLDSRQNSSDLISAINGGQCGIVIDALDEAHLRAGTSNFRAFLQDIEKLSEGINSSNPRIILLSRPDTAAVIKLFFKSMSCGVSSAVLDYFSTDQANDFIENYMRLRGKEFDGDSKYDIFKLHPKPFANLRNQRVNEISRALSRQDASAVDTWKDVYQFLGYAPVLSVLAESLAVPNPAAEIQKPMTHATTPHEILKTIIGELLLREQIKFKESVLSRIRSELSTKENWDNSQLIYSPEDQCELLISTLYDTPLAVHPSEKAPPAIQQQLHEAQHTFIRDHPFLAGSRAANIVFADYLDAVIATDPRIELVFSDQIGKSITDVGPFFAPFVHTLAEKNDIDDLPNVDESIVQLLIDSHLQAISNEDRLVDYQYIHDGENGDLSLRRSKTSISTWQDLRFSVPDSVPILHLTRTASHCLILLSEGIIELGIRGDRFIIGPNCLIMAEEISIDASDISINPSRREAREASGLVSINGVTAPNLKSVDCPIEGTLAIQSESVHPLLRKYLADINIRGPKSSMADLVNLRSMLKVFRQGNGPLPSVFSDKLEQRIVKDNPQKKRYMAALMDLGIITKESSHYYLQVAKLAENGANLTNILEGHLDPGTDKFIQKIAG